MTRRNSPRRPINCLQSCVLSPIPFKVLYMDKFHKRLALDSQTSAAEPARRPARIVWMRFQKTVNTALSATTRKANRINLFIMIPQKSFPVALHPGLILPVLPGRYHHIEPNTTTLIMMMSEGLIS